MSVVNNTNKGYVLNYEGVEDLIVKIKDTFVRKTHIATENTPGLIKAWDNDGIISLQSHDSNAKNYPVQVTPDGTAFVNVPEAEIPEIPENTDESVKNIDITDNQKYYLLGQPTQNSTGQAYTEDGCYISNGSVYSRYSEVLSCTNMGDDEKIDRDPDTWQYVKFDADGFMGVEIPKVEIEIPDVVIPEIKAIDEDMIDIAWDEVIGIDPAAVDVNYINNSKLT